jgi:maltose alpha-D-glucosyltransferase/alpha-amylase
LTQKLDYLQDLGVTAIWLLPFYPSPLRDDGYDIADYRNVHPAYGSLRDFRRFVREAHTRGLRINTELVVNHTSDQHPWFQAARRAKPGSKKRDFYVWSADNTKYRDTRIIFCDTEESNWTWDPIAGAYYWHRFFSHQPDLNFDNPLVRQAVFRNMRFWLDMGVDGLRLDAVPYLCEREGTNNENLPETHDVLKELRRLLDQHYEDRMLLAEANQWPDDVRPYFGSGDECHMAYHFPLMPRIFMGLRQEDSYPITEIMRCTPDIPDNCQWALFLRNHDELTLEMVTDEERDYMYREYAADPRMRLNLGIRRRLAPLLEDSLGSIQLLYSLLFSLPGTPVLYYGDEIGMGDNFFLGDRNGVRTPMQWSSDRNAGFSRADPQRLYAPLIMDPVYGYQAINVESQQRNSTSLLWWMKRAIALRKQHRVFGRGRIAFLSPNNRKILAYICYDETETILVVANLSRYVQPVALELGDYRGLLPREMFGRTEFPPIEETPYFLSLGPHAFYWFELLPAPETVVIRQYNGADTPLALEKSLPVLRIEDGWDTMFSGAAGRRLETDVFPAILPLQRWFGGKAREIRRVHLLDYAVLRQAAPPLLFALVDVTYAEGASEQYTLFLGVCALEQAEALMQLEPGVIMARVRGPQGEGILHNALADAQACTRLLGLIREQQHVATARGELRAFTAADEALDIADSVGDIQRIVSQQSNSAIVYDSRHILKLFRRVEPGVNPDLEVSRYLAETPSFAHTPPLEGGIEYRGPGAKSMTLAMLQGYVRDADSGWDYTLDLLGRHYEDALGQMAPPEALDLSLTHLLARAQEPLPEAAFANSGTYVLTAQKLGERTAEMHLALGRATDQPAFCPEPMNLTALRQLSATLREHTQVVLGSLRNRLDTLPEALHDQVQHILDRRAPLLERLRRITKIDRGITRIRCHGDYHLGQVLWVANNFVLFDFEGEPARSLAERRRKQSPLKDVASMLRSLSYASYAALFNFVESRPDDFLHLEPWANVWQQWVSIGFLQSYLETAQGASFIPDDRQHLAILLEAFLLDKALHELHYELNHRPDWLRIPLQGMTQLLDRDTLSVG